MWKERWVREQFPSLQCQVDGVSPVFLDGPGGSQVPRQVIEAVSRCLIECNANCGGAFSTSQRATGVVESAHQAAADLLNAPSPQEIIFGANMTSLTFHLSRSISRTLTPGDEIVVTRLDHEANVSPWILAARDAGATVKKVDIHPDDATLDMKDLERQLSARTRIVAVTAASNLVGSLVDVPAVAKMVRECGALLFVDAVHAAPHVPLDVQAWDCDFLVCSAYKFFGPHVGILWGRRKWLEQLPVYKLRVVTEEIPGRWMTGTQNHEGLAGLTAAVEYLAEIGRNVNRQDNQASAGRRLDVRRGLDAIREYEKGLSLHLLEELEKLGNVSVWGIREKDRVAQRVPTFAMTSPRCDPKEMATRLASRQIHAWSGNNYAIELTERLGLEDRGGVLRVGLMHYNTHEEIDRLAVALSEM